MGGKRSASKPTKNKHIEEEEEEDLEGGEVKGKLKVGDVVWVKTHGSWWPAQVFDEDLVGKETKPRGKKLVGEVLVRLYGDYDFLYWNPEKHRTEFTNILKRNNGSYKAIFEKSFEKELALAKSEGLKRKRSEPRGVRTKNEELKVLRMRQENSTDQAPKDRKLKQSGVNKNQEGNIAKLPNVIARVSRTGKARGSRGKVEDMNTTLTGAKTAPKADNVDSVTHLLQKSPDHLSLRRIRVMQSLGLVAPSDSPFRRNGVV